MYNRYREEEQEEMLKERGEPKEETVREEAEEKSEPKRKKKAKASETEALKEEIEALREEVKRLNDLYLRTLADAENFKRRINEERIRERKYGAQFLLEKLVNVVDIFGKAVNIETDDDKLKNFLIGFDMIHKQLQQILGDEGIKKIETAERKFDPLYHHALEIDCVEGLEDDIIIEEIQTGYMYKDRVLRPALVRVNKIQKEEYEDGENNRN
ncbi:MAG: nucleotide exchange factor GrpE [Bacilli bacterium]|jgi:molecular chaperone GrpE|nr:nucleotide exchange factor GrpE [Acholeplasmataceae bacterium]